MIIHHSPYPDLAIPAVTLPTFIFRPLDNSQDEQVPGSQSRLDSPLLMAVPQDEKYNPKPTRPRASAEGGALSLRQAKERAEMWALGLRQELGWGGGDDEQGRGKRREAAEEGEAERVLSVVSENQHDYACAVLGANLVGACAALHNPSYTPSELAHQLRLVSSSAILCSTKAYEKCRQAAEEASSEAGEGLEALPSTPKIWVFEEPQDEDGSAAAPSTSSRPASWFEAGSLALSSSTSPSSLLSGLWTWHTAHVRPGDDAVYCFSSGTSGRPKAVRLSHGNLVANTIQATCLMRDRTESPLFDRWHKGDKEGWYSGLPRAAKKQQASKSTTAGSGGLLRKLKSKLNLSRSSPDKGTSSPSTTSGSSGGISIPKPSQEIHIDLLPQFHCYGLLVSLVALHTATPRYVLGRFSLPTFLHLVQDHKVTFAFVVPPVLLALARSKEVDEYDLSSLRRLASGAASLPEGLRREVWEKRKVMVTDGFGMSEMSPIVCLQTLADVCEDIQGESEEEKTQRLNGVGRLAPSTQARVIDEEGNDVPAGSGKTGELLLRGPQRMTGYLRNPEANESAFHRDGSDGGLWLKTGDVVSLSPAPHSYLRITDRQKDVIKVKGFQVSPAELEDRILSDSTVHDVAVVGLTKPGGDGEEVPWAFCVPAEGQSKEKGQDAKEVAQRVNESGKLAKYKYLGGATWVKDLPKSDAGKVLKRQLRDWAKEEGIDGR
ncbi:acetyl-CoA synthetase-like protein [Jaminaea rosea]|uniref:Acetyl-CoA synthetase-like protein n=1 Tax=Jaminaea rosea TaxID=1569628 RepID=A0A316UM01_9BASI|nr:acetyl-CoA synthetase-like protein [Jaminaea rosea]PWN26312.1 acetyl-CoA synthetase-like protein [Jaminaea rosea]